MATIDKNFRIKNGLVVEGSTATVNGNQILTENASDQYILNLIGGETLVKSVTGNLSVDNAGQLSINETGLADSLTVDSNFLYDDGQGHIMLDSEGVYDDLIAGGVATTTNISDAIADEVTRADAAYDASGAAGTAEQNAKNYADGLAVNYDAAGSAQGAYDNAVSAAATDATNKANTAESNANDYTDTAITNLNLSGTYDALGAATTALNDAKAYTDQEVSALVDSAPALLDTLNELAAAIADNPNYATDVANLVATKADTTYVDSEISDLDTAAQGYATTAQSNAASYTDSAVGSALESAEGYADSAAGQALSDAENYTDLAISNGNSAATPAYQAINLAGYTRQVGNWALASTAGSQVTAFSYSASWGSAEFLVRVMSNTSGHQHSQLSKILVTTDGVGNVAITEYGIVTTNGNMGDITASNAGGTVSILVTPTYASSEVIVSGTLLAYND